MLIKYSFWPQNQGLIGTDLAEGEGVLVGGDDLVVVAEAETVLETELVVVGLGVDVVVAETLVERVCVGEEVVDAVELGVLVFVGDDVVVLLGVVDLVDV